MGNLSRPANELFVVLLIVAMTSGTLNGISRCVCSGFDSDMILNYSCLDYRMPRSIASAESRPFPVQLFAACSFHQ